jgi:gluconokinase
MIADWIAARKSAVLACSALKEEYRAELRVGPEVRFVYLRAPEEVLRRRLQARAGHYMKAGMLESQLAALEEPRGAVVVDVSGTVEESVAAVLKVTGY